MISAIIVAAGKGVRMKSRVRKQYMNIAGCPVILHTLKAFDSVDAIDRICVVIHKDDFQYFKEKILDNAGVKTPLVLAKGGKERQQSVLNGLNAINDPGGIVLIHDGVRPLVSKNLIQACIREVHETGACIAAVPAVDTLKMADDSHMIKKTIARDKVYAAQTPQAFEFDLIKSAHALSVKEGFVATDDASVAEFAGYKVKLVSGHPGNIKITTPQDIVLAEAILAKRKNR